MVTRNVRYSCHRLRKELCSHLNDARKTIHAHRVKIGVRFAREHNDYKNAMKAYERALEIDPECIDAFVARGAL